MSRTDALLLILGMAAVTYVPRALPVFFTDRLTLNGRIRNFLSLLPYTALAALIFPGVLSVDAAHPLFGIAGAAAAAVLALKKTHPQLTLEAAVPCPTQADGWCSAQRERYRRILELCDYETMVQEKYTRDCMQRRNRYMVDHAALLLAVHDGQPGGTQRTMEYAMRRGLQIVDIPPVMET